MSDFLSNIAAAIRNSPAHDVAMTVLGQVPGAPPVIQSIHILGIAVIVASAGFMALRVLGVAARSQLPAEMVARLQPWFWWALPVMLITGAVFVCARPARYFTNPIFGIKLMLLLPAIALAAWLYRRCAASGRVNSGALTRLIALTSLMLWLAIILAGRWIAYVDYLLPIE
jgi:hypothetical protein